MLPAILTLLLLNLASAVKTKEDLVIIGLAPLESKAGICIKAAADLALQDVNNDLETLSKYNVTVHWVDTEVGVMYIPVQDDDPQASSQHV